MFCKCVFVFVNQQSMLSHPPCGNWNTRRETARVTESFYPFSLHFNDNLFLCLQMNFHSSSSSHHPQHNASSLRIYLVAFWPALGQYFVCALRRINVTYSVFFSLFFYFFFDLVFPCAWWILFALYSLGLFSCIGVCTWISFSFSFAFCAHKSYCFRNVFRFFAIFCCYTIALSTSDITEFLPLPYIAALICYRLPWFHCAQFSVISHIVSQRNIDISLKKTW